jgi:uncharacterized protein YcbX
VKRCARAPGGAQPCTPVKSCAGIALTRSLLLETGLDLDRHWMLVDEKQRFVTQRELPRMALVQPTLKHSEMVLRAPGMLALHIALDTVESACRVRVWKDDVAAYDMGDLAAQWFSDFLGRRVRLVRFDPEQRRLSNKRWTGRAGGRERVLRRLSAAGHRAGEPGRAEQAPAAAGEPAATMSRLRPNLVLDGSMRTARTRSTRSRSTRRRARCA